MIVKSYSANECAEQANMSLQIGLFVDSSEWNFAKRLKYDLKENFSKHSLVINLNKSN